MPIDQFSLPAGSPVDSLWQAVAEQTQAWLVQRGLPARDAVLLLPFAALLEPARQALARRGGWQPRVETPLTMAAALGPPMPAAPGLCSGEATLDRLAAALLLRRQPWGAAWQARDPAGFAGIVAAVVDAAQALRVAALQRPPEAREAFWADARLHLAPAVGPAAAEALLLRVALEWAAAAGPAGTDALFAARPAAWIVLRLGGPEPMAEALLGHAETPSLLLLADPPAADPFAEIAARADLQRIVCDDFESEAQAATAEVIEALNAGRQPVALVVLDREVVRRARALLAGAGVALIDETGWRLATTRAAASVVALLRAASLGAGADAWLEWLKTWPAAPAAALDALEAQWRGRRVSADRKAAEDLWRRAQAHLQPLAALEVRPLGGWLELTLDCLQRGGSLDRLAADAAGAQVLAALGWPAGAPWREAAAEVQFELPEFIAWVESTLEQLPFLPPPDPGAQVVLTPLSRAFGRPFEQVVIPGADHLRLGEVSAQPALIGDGLAAALGLEHKAARRERQRLALAQVLRARRVTLLRRRRDDDEALAESPDVEWLLLARARSVAMPAWPLRSWQPGTRSVMLEPVALPRPGAALSLPTTLSASQLEALRECPYRFFSRAVLRLDEPDELEAALAKRDYGTWLHAVLHRFHSARDRAQADTAQLEDAAHAVTRELALDPAELLPFRASFEAFAPAYLTWLDKREASGWQWHSGETDYVLEAPGINGLRLRGRIDRLDQGPAGATQLLDYKTGSAEALKRRVKEPLEDTQLAFYAALLGGEGDLRAAYLALDDAKAPLEIEHVGVAETAAALLLNLRGEWQRLQQGAGLPALGEGRVCETCEARGLCRRDHWSTG